MRKIWYVGVLALLAIVAAGCMGSDDDSSSRKAAIGSSTPVAGGGSISSPAVLNGAAIKVEGWTWAGSSSIGVGSQSGTQSGASGPPNLTAFSVQKNIDNASTTLFKLFVQGASVQPMATLTFKVGTALTYTFSNVYVKSFSQSGSGSDGNEEVTFVYTKVTMQNAAAGASQPVTYDIPLNKVT